MPSSARDSSDARRHERYLPAFSAPWSSRCSLRPPSARRPRFVLVGSCSFMPRARCAAQSAESRCALSPIFLSPADRLPFVAIFDADACSVAAMPRVDRARAQVKHLPEICAARPDVACPRSPGACSPAPAQTRKSSVVVASPPVMKAMSETAESPARTPEKSKHVASARESSIDERRGRVAPDEPPDRPPDASARCAFPDAKIFSAPRKHAASRFRAEAAGARCRGDDDLLFHERQFCRCPRRPAPACRLSSASRLMMSVCFARNTRYARSRRSSFCFMRRRSRQTDCAYEPVLRQRSKMMSCATVRECVGDVESPPSAQQSLSLGMRWVPGNAATAMSSRRRRASSTWCSLLCEFVDDAAISSTFERNTMPRCFDARKSRSVQRVGAAIRERSAKRRKWVPPAEASSRVMSRRDTEAPSREAASRSVALASFAASRRSVWKMRRAARETREPRPRREQQPPSHAIWKSPSEFDDFSTRWCARVSFVCLFVLRAERERSRVFIAESRAQRRLCDVVRRLLSSLLILMSSKRVRLPPARRVDAPAEMTMFEFTCAKMSRSRPRECKSTRPRSPCRRFCLPDAPARSPAERACASACDVRRPLMRSSQAANEKKRYKTKKACAKVMLSYACLFSSAALSPFDKHEPSGKTQRDDVAWASSSRLSTSRPFSCRPMPRPFHRPPYSVHSARPAIIIHILPIIDIPRVIIHSRMSFIFCYSLRLLFYSFRRHTSSFRRLLALFAVIRAMIIIILFMPIFSLNMPDISFIFLLPLPQLFINTCLSLSSFFTHYYIISPFIFSFWDIKSAFTLVHVFMSSACLHIFSYSSLSFFCPHYASFLSSLLLLLLFLHVYYILPHSLLHAIFFFFLIYSSLLLYLLFIFSYSSLFFVTLYFFHYFCYCLPIHYFAWHIIHLSSLLFSSLLSSSFTSHAFRHSLHIIFIMLNIFISLFIIIFIFIFFLLIFASFVFIFFRHSLLLVAFHTLSCLFPLFLRHFIIVIFITLFINILLFFAILRFLSYYYLFIFHYCLHIHSY